MGVLEPTSVSCDRRRRNRGRQRNHRASGNEWGEHKRAFRLDQALTWEWAGVPDLPGAGDARESLIDDSLGDFDHLSTASPRFGGDGAEADAAGRIVRGVLQDQRPRLVEHVRDIDPRERGDWLGHPFEEPGGLEVALLVGYANREPAQQELRRRP